MAAPTLPQLVAELDRCGLVTPARMRVVCSWCQTVQSEGDPDGERTDTICEACMAVHFPLVLAARAVVAAPASTPGLSPFAEKMLAALRRLTKEREAHPCGGFTTDDMQWQMGTAFTPDETLHDAIDELEKARLVRFAGFDDEDAIGTCYALREGAQS